MKAFKISGALIICIAALFTGCSKEDITLPDTTEGAVGTAKMVPAPANAVLVENQYIVTMNKEFAASALSRLTDFSRRDETMKASATELVSKYKIDRSAVKSTFHTALLGFTATMSREEALSLAKDPAVSAIEQDQIIQLNDNQLINGITSLSTQQVPYGVTRVGKGSGAGKRAWIIDTGIDLDHPDLNVNTAKSRSFIPYTSPDDQNGHGTHVAGTVGAYNNTIGVVGVAAGAELVAVKVLDQAGSGTTSGVIKGVDYVAAMGRAGEAANMSLGGGLSSALDYAVKSASAKGIFFAVAAGNSGSHAGLSSPARVNGPYIFTVSAMDRYDQFASFSNFGNPPVDFCAPGVSILSTWPGGTYKTLSGTSMATPHVTGLTLLRNGAPAKGGYVRYDPDGIADPIAVK